MSTEWVVIPIRGKDRPDVARRLLAASPDPALVRVTGDGFKVPLTVAIDAGLVEPPDAPQESVAEPVAPASDVPPVEDASAAPAAPEAGIDVPVEPGDSDEPTDEAPAPKKASAKKATS